MIHVQIASQLTVQGVAGVRWVLVEPIDVQLASEPAPAAALATPDTAAAAVDTSGPGGSTASALRLGALKLLVLALGLGAAIWTARVQVGPPWEALTTPLAPARGQGPAVPALSGPRHPGATPVPPAQPRTAPPAATPDSPAIPAIPAEPAASAAMPRLTAAL
jgi:hypothetical protein